MVQVIANRPPGTEIELVEMPECDAMFVITVPERYSADEMTTFAKHVKAHLPSNVRAFVVQEGVKIEVKTLQHEDTQKALERIEQLLQKQTTFNERIFEVVAELDAAIRIMPTPMSLNQPIGQAAARQPPMTPLAQKIASGVALTEEELNELDELLKELPPGTPIAKKGSL